MRIVVGLGNPGTRYERTRHNVGFMVVENLATRWNVGIGAPRCGLRQGAARFCGRPVLLVEPYLYMNLSGEALSGLDLPWSAEDLVVVHDDLDIAAGELRVRRGGGAAGHRGLSSLIDACGAAFERVRVGVGRPRPGVDPAEHVLAEMEGDEMARLRSSAVRAADAVECLLSDGIERAMNRFNTRGPAPVE
jgi:PTH1 family peptidyl-tRNA hydrolase